jgi:hypothetical protein
MILPENLFPPTSQNICDFIYGTTTSSTYVSTILPYSFHPCVHAENMTPQKTNPYSNPAPTCAQVWYPSVTLDTIIELAQGITTSGGITRDIIGF